MPPKRGVRKAPSKKGEGTSEPQASSSARPKRGRRKLTPLPEEDTVQENGLNGTFVVDRTAAEDTVMEEEEEEEVQPPPKRGRKRMSPSPTPARTSRVLRAPPEVHLPLPNDGKEYRVATMGSGEVGELGHGPLVTEKRRPGIVKTVDKVPITAYTICAGGIHTLAASADKVYSFGCNDEGVLGRPTSEEEENFRPDLIPLFTPLLNSCKVSKLTAGSSHSAALLQDGTIYVWGTFRDVNGPIGLRANNSKREETPVQLFDETMRFRDIASGEHHLVALTHDEPGRVFTAGAGVCGELGRLSVRERRGTHHIAPLEVPLSHVHDMLEVKVGKKQRGAARKVNLSQVNISGVRTARNSTFVIMSTGQIVVFGANNKGQLGLDPSVEACITRPSLTPGMMHPAKKRWKDVCGGMHHTLLLDEDGHVFALGRAHFGILGISPFLLGEEHKDGIFKATKIPDLQYKETVKIGAADFNSFAITKEGTFYAWGMGQNNCLGTDSEVDELTPKALVSSATFKDVSGGSNHVVVLAEVD